MPPSKPVRPALPTQTLRSLTAHYDAGEPLSCEPLTHGLLNHGYRVATTRGRFFLKHHLDADPADPAPLERRHRATVRMEALGLPVVPPVVATGDGRTVVVVGDRCYALHPWVEGRHRHGAELTAAESRRLGALLGRVHTRLPQALPAQAGPASVPAASALPDDTDRRIDALLARVRARPRRTGFDELAEYRLLERRRLLRRYADARPAADAAPAAGWVHGDFHPLNLLYGGAGAGEPVAIVDWDRLAVQPRAEEAVRSAAIFFLRPDGSLDLRKVRAFARAYRHAAEASPAELGAAVHRVWWERLNDFWMLCWRYECGDSRPAPQFAAAAALVVWWSRRYPAVHAAFCG